MINGLALLLIRWQSLSLYRFCIYLFYLSFFFFSSRRRHTRYWRDWSSDVCSSDLITSQEVREALLAPISTIVDSVRVTLERCPPELSADLVDRGLVLAGGGALLRGLDRLLTEETGLPVHVAEDPLSAVAEGTGRALSEIKFLRQVATSDTRWNN